MAIRYGLLFFAVGSCLVGCQSSGTSKDIPLRVRSPHEGALPQLTRPIAAYLNSRTTGQHDLRVVDIAFDVVRVDIPVTNIRHTRKIWNHIDELRVEPPVATRLARNGLRLGVATPDAWPALRAILEASDARVRRQQLIPQRGLPLTIQLATITEPESIFRYNRKGGLVGQTFRRGEKLLNVEYWYHAELGRTTDLRITFEIRYEKGVMTWEKREGIIRQVPAYEQHIFDEAQASLTLHGDEFLIIGVSEQASHDYLLGPSFLMTQEDGMKWETFFCLTPKPYQTKQPRLQPS